MSATIPVRPEHSRRAPPDHPEHSQRESPVRPEHSRRKLVEGHSLCERLPLLASAPGGIKKLRELILELAVRGKLVPQDPKDEPASELLERIQAERLRMEEAGVLKKTTPLQINEDDKPYDTPVGWTWVRLGGLLSKIGAGSTPLGGKKAYVSEGVKFLRSQNVWNEGLRLNDVALIPAVVHQKMSGTHVQAGDLLFNITGASIGRCALVPDDFDVANVSQHVSIIRPIDADTRFFLHKLLISRYVQKAVMDVQVGVSREGLSIRKLSQFVIPLPPLTEQHRIVAKVDELMALCDRLEAQQADAEAAHATLIKTLLDTLTQSQSAEDFAANWQRLSAHFDTLFTTESSIDALKQTLLQLAVMGKLVPQDPGEESAGELLKRLRGRSGSRQIGRRTNNASFGEVDHQEALPALPAGWECVSVGDLGPIAGGATPNKSDASLWSGTIPWVSPKDMKRPYINDTLDHVSAVSIEKTPLKLIPAGSLLLVVRGMILAHSFPVAISQVPLCINQDMKAISLLPEMAEFVLYALQALKPRILQLIERSSHGTCKLKSEALFGYPFPLPPLAEQRRIAAKLDELIVLCDLLKQQLGEARALQQRLGEALVEQGGAI